MKPVNVLLNGKIFILIFCVLAGQLLTGKAFAQVKFYAVASERNLSISQPFQIQYVVQGTKSVSRITVPYTPDFNLEDSFSTPLTAAIDHNTLQWVDTYSKVVVLTPTRTGRFIIPAAVVVIDGKKYLSNPIKLTVTQTGLSSLLSPESVVEDASELKAGEDIDEKIRKNFFLKAVPTKKVCYVGEPIQVDYKAYSRLNSNSQVVKRPAFPGFSVVEMVDNYDNKPDVESVKGIPFYTNLIRKVQLFPLQEGTYQLDAAEIESVIHFTRSGQNSQLEKLLGASSGGRSREAFDHHISLRTLPESIKVKPLPLKDQPEEFAGAVGQFQLNVEFPRKDIRKGELTTIKWVISGKGNLQLVTLPDIQWPNNLDTSEPSVKEEINRYVYPLSGRKIFEYSFSVKDTGDYSIPSLSFSYFDPASEKYTTLKSGPVNFHVGEAAGVGLPEGGRINLTEGEKPIHLYFFGAVVAIILGWVSYQLVHLRKSKRQLENKKEEPVQTAKPLAKPDEFSSARQSIIAEDKRGFYNEVQRVIWKTAAEKCEILPSALNKNNIAFRLRTQEVPEALITELSGVLGECEWALYTPETNTADMKQLLQRAEHVVNSLENAS
jgi:hypothetical protein